MKKLICTFLCLSLLAAASAFVFAEDTMSSYCVYDVSDILSYEDWDGLETRSMDLSKNNRCAVYTILLPGLSEYTVYEDDIKRAALDVLNRNDLGYGNGKDCVALLINTETEEFAVVSYGSRGSVIFDSDSLSSLTDTVRVGIMSVDYASAIDNFVTECGYRFEEYNANGGTYTADTGNYTAEDYDRTEFMSTDCVYDYAGLLSESELKQLEEKAEYVSQKYEFGVYIYIVNDYTDIYDGGDVFYACEYVYEGQDFGYGSGRDGIMLFMSMDERDYATYRTYGKGYYAFTEYGLYELEEYFLEPFYSNDWYGGFDKYVDGCQKLLQMAADGNPLDDSSFDPGEYDPDNDNDYQGDDSSVYVFAGIGACIISLLVCLVLLSKMKTANQKTQANDYIVRNGIRMYSTRDIYTHSTQSRTRIHTESSNSRGSGGGHSFSVHSGGGGGGHSGKF